ncbi:MAG: hypothetical protein SGJ07_06675, partial [Rhodospirillaceae bacterium]|nr:hypothetical protein [Rhodospirillaceae bacterium]
MPAGNAQRYGIGVLIAASLRQRPFSKVRPHYAGIGPAGTRVGREGRLGASIADSGRRPSLG